MDDVQAIHRLKHADIGGLEILVSRYQVKAVRTAFLITHDESLAEDVVQETFIRIFQRIRQFDENRSFEPYFMRSVVNAALNAIRKKAKWTQDDSGTNMDELEALLLQAASVEEQVEFAQLKVEIMAALDKLSARQRAAVVQRYYLGMSEKEMADTLEAAPGTVKWLLNAARTRLREILQERSAKRIPRILPAF
jgi:RNA polymerase sigma-70 factor (ECF subfamily)